MKIDFRNYTYNKQTGVSRQPSFRAMRLFSTNPKYKSIEKDLLDEVIIFHKNKNNANFLGQGLFSKVYELIKFPNIVIKDAVINYDNFKQEGQGLINVPASLVTSQQYVTHAFEDKEYKHYLLSTKVEGVSANPKSKPWNRENLRNLFYGMFEMDKKGFYHGDLNNGNIKIDNNNNVNFLDYQWATQREVEGIKYDSFSGECLPGFIPTMNAQMFEMASIPYYIQLLSNNNENPIYFILDYLNEKSLYHSNRANFFALNSTIEKMYSEYERKNFRNALVFERAQSVVLRNAINEILKLESIKFQFLSSEREAYRFIDPNIEDKNILTAPSAYLVALNNLQIFRKEVAKLQKEVKPESFHHDYLKGMEKYGNYWMYQLKNWSIDAFEHTYKEIKRDDYTYWTKINTTPEYFKSMSNFIPLIKSNYAPKYSDNFQIKNFDRDCLLQKLKNNIKIPNATSKSLTDKQIQKQLEVSNVFNQLLDAYNNNKTLIVLNKALLLSRKLIEIQKTFDYNDERSFHFYELENFSLNFAKKLFEQIHDNICSLDLDSPVLYGYDDMNEY